MRATRSPVSACAVRRWYSCTPAGGQGCPNASNCGCSRPTKCCLDVTCQVCPACSPENSSLETLGLRESPLKSLHACMPSLWSYIACWLMKTASSFCCRKGQPFTDMQHSPPSVSAIVLLTYCLPIPYFSQGSPHYLLLLSGTPCMPSMQPRSTNCKHTRHMIAIASQPMSPSQRHNAEQAWPKATLACI